jgi:cell division protein FtsA
MDADIILPADARRNGCALVNIGADTTTIVIYKNDMMRKLAVVPLGSNNITMDLCSLQISKDEAEEIKITHGYKPANGDICSVDSDTVNNVIGARMNEILQNVKYQIEESNENVVHIIFTGGGSKLKNFELLLDEYIPNYRCNIVSEPKFSLISSNGVNLNGIFSTALYSLLKLGSVNCCEELKPATYTPPVEQKLEFLENDEPQEEIKEEPQKPKEENKKEESAPKNTSTKKPSKWSKLIDTVKNTVTQGTLDFIGQITEDDDADNNNK